MKNLLRLLGIIAVAAVIGFTITGCGGSSDSDDTTTNRPGTTNPDTGLPGATALCTFDDTRWVYYGNGTVLPTNTQQSDSVNGFMVNPCTNHGGIHYQHRVLYAWGTPGLVITLNPAGTEYIVGVNKTTVGNAITIPAYYRGAVSFDKEVDNYNEFKPVKAITSLAFEGNTNITTVGFGAETMLEKIGDRAFEGCTALTAVNGIPAGVTDIELNAFYGCTTLATVTFAPNSGLRTIGEGAFQGCIVLNIPAATPNANFIPAGVTSIGKKAFSGAAALTRINIPSGITSINEETFMGCVLLNRVVFAPNHRVRVIDSDAFSGCAALASLVDYIPNSITTIGSHAFKGTIKLDDFYITRSVTAVGLGAFENWVTGQKITVLGKAENTNPNLDSGNVHYYADLAWGNDWRTGSTAATIKYEN